MEDLIKLLDENYRSRQVIRRDAERELKGKEILFPFNFMPSPRRRSRRTGVIRDVSVHDDKFLLDIKVYRLDGTGYLANRVSVHFDDIEVIKDE